MKWLTAAASVVLLVTFPANAASRPKRPCEQVVTPDESAPNGVKVHAGPSLASAWISGVSRGQHVRCIDARSIDGETLYQIRVPDHSSEGLVGWSSAKYMKPIKPEEIGFKICFLDVGSGDAAIITVGDATIIIDGGPNPSYLATYMREHQIPRNSISLVALSHPGPDHFRGLTCLLSGRHTILDYLDSGYRPTHAVAAFDKFATAMRRAAVHCWNPDLSKTVFLPEIPEVDFTVFRPPLGKASNPEEIALEKETASMILLVEIGGKSILFTGDIAGKRENEDGKVHARFAEGFLIGAFKTAARVDVMKVPNHGADTSSTSDFIHAYHPRYAIISASPRNFKPDEDVVQRYKEAGATVLRTDTTPRHGNDHIQCVRDPGEDLLCNYEYVLND